MLDSEHDGPFYEEEEEEEKEAEGEEEDDSSFPTITITPGRIIRSPLKRASHVHVDMCLSAGPGSSEIYRQTITKGKHGKQVYKEARKSKWGGIFLKFHTEEEEEGEEEEGEGIHTKR